jgi:hypothetical protein
MGFRSHASRRVLRRVAKSVAFGAAFGLAGTVQAQIVGFGGSSKTGWTANSNVATNPGTGSLPTVSGTGGSGDVLTMTDLNGGEATSYWFNTPQNILNFRESFTYTSGGGADGLGVVWQNQGLNALGGGGGSKGYGGITSAAALALNIYSGNSGSGSGYNGTTTTNTGTATTPTPGGVDLTNGSPVNVTLSYNQTDRALTETMTQGANSFTRVWRGIDIAGQVGGSAATVGFTGGTGGVTANQSITNFQFTPGGAVPTPVATITPLAATGYNQNMIISAVNGSANVTATMDGGTAKTGDTFYEMGITQFTAPQTGPPPVVSGVPKAGSVFGSGTDANHTFVLQPNGAGQNDAVMLDAANASGSLNLVNPNRFSTLSLLLSAGNGGGPINYSIRYAGGTTQTGTIPGPDWFNNTPIAWDANGRVDVALDDYNNVNDGNPRMYQDDITLTNTAANVLGIDFAYTGLPTGTDREAIFGISGQAVPEPSSLAFLTLGAAGFVIRRRRVAR